MSKNFGLSQSLIDTVSKVVKANVHKEEETDLSEMIVKPDTRKVLSPKEVETVLAQSGYLDMKVKSVAPAKNVRPSKEYACVLDVTFKDDGSFERGVSTNSRVYFWYDRNGLMKCDF